MYPLLWRRRVGLVECLGDQVRVLHYPVPSIGSSPTRARGMGRSTLDVMLGTGTLVAGTLEPEMARACIGRGKPVGVALKAAGSGSDQDRVGS